MTRILTSYARDEFHREVLNEFPELELVHNPPTDTFTGLVRFAFHAMVPGAFDAVMIEGTRPLIFLSLARMVLGNRRTRIVSVMPYFPPLPGNVPGRIMRKLLVKWMALGTDRFMPISTEEIESYHRAYGIPKQKLAYLPYKMNSQKTLAKLPREDGDFIWAGGDSIRDYPTLFKAVEGSGIETRVFTNLRFPPGERPDNVRIMENDNTTESYYGPCARAMMAVFPLEKGHIRSSGQASYIGAMFMEKPVIISDTPGVRDIVRDGETGLLVPPGDAGALKIAIERLAKDPELRKRLGKEAHNSVKDRFTVENFCRNILRTIQEKE